MSRRNSDPTPSSDGTKEQARTRLALKVGVLHCHNPSFWDVWDDSTRKRVSWLAATILFVYLSSYVFSDATIFMRT